MANKITDSEVLSALEEIKEPRLGKSITSAGLIQDVKVNKETVNLTLVLISPENPSQDEIKNDITGRVKSLDGISEVKIKTIVEVPLDGKLKNTGKSTIKNLIAVASGKGGVGKTTVSVNIAVSLAQSGVKVGLMDADVYGPNVPIMMGVRGLPAQDPTTGRMVPAEAHGVKIISIGFMAPQDKPIVWRGPMLHKAIQQFVQDVEWGELDYLVVDLPPGTGDTQLSLAQTVSVTGAVIVTLPQLVSLEDARRGLEMFRQLQIPILGVVENMSYLELDDGKKMDIFGSGGGKNLAEDAGVDFIGGIPIDPAVRIGGDNGKPVVISQPGSEVSKTLKKLAFEVAYRSGVVALENQTQSIPINIIN